MADISRLVLEVDSKGVRNATDDLNRFGKTSKSTEKTVGGLSKGIGGMSKGFIAGASAIAGVSVALKGMVSFAKASISAFSEFEMVKTNLQVVTGSAEQAEKQFRDLKDLASKTPFEVTGLANAGIMLQQSGVQASELTDTLRMLGDVAGGNNEKFNRIAQNYAQILSVGKASAMDMRQFAMAGLPVMQMMKDMGIQGQATAEQVTEMFKKMTKEGGTFFNGMNLQADTLNGKVSTLKDTWKDYLATFAETSGLAETWKTVVDYVTQLIQENTDLMTQQEEMAKLEEGYLNGQIIPSYEYLTKLVEQYTNTLSESFGYSVADIEAIMGKTTVEGSLEDAYKKKRLELEAIKDQYNEQMRLLGIEKDRVEENKRLVALQQQQAQEYSSIFAEIEAEYMEKSEAKLTDLQKVQRRINELDELLRAKKEVVEYEDRGYGQTIPHTKLVDAYTDEQKALIQALIDMLAEERNALRENTKAVEDDTKTTEETKFSLGQYAGQKAMGMIQGTDVGNFVQGVQEGGVWGGIINTLLGAISNVVGGLEGMNYVLSPITELFKELAPTFKSLLLPAMVFGQALKGLGKIIQVILNFLSGGLIEDMADEWDNLLNTTKDVNENMKSLTDSLLELQDAIDKQEQYYLSEKRNILAENRYTTPVNDMILTPEGKFSTNPRDTIIATKDPKGLVGSGVNITINNTQAGNVDVSARQDNMGNLIIDISKSVARDFATGSNGWENAVNYRNDKESGRRLY